MLQYREGAQVDRETIPQESRRISNFVLRTRIVLYVLSWLPATKSTGNRRIASLPCHDNETARRNEKTVVYHTCQIQQQLLHPTPRLANSLQTKTILSPPTQEGIKKPFSSPLDLYFSRLKFLENTHLHLYDGHIDADFSN